MDRKVDQIIKGSQSLIFKNAPYIVSAASVVGKQRGRRTAGGTV